MANSKRSTGFIIMTKLQQSGQSVDTEAFLLNADGLR